MLDDEREEMSPLRRRLLELVSARPGMHSSQISRETGLPRGTLRYHLDLLDEEQRVRSVGAGRERRFFSADLTEQRARLLALVHQGRTPDVARYIQENPGCRQVDVCADVGVTRKTLRSTVASLVEHELVAERRTLHAVYYFPHENLGSLLTPVPTQAPPPGPVPGVAMNDMDVA